MKVKRYTINGHKAELIETNTFIDKDGYVNIPADFDSLDEYFEAYWESLPEDFDWSSTYID